VAENSFVQPCGKIAETSTSKSDYQNWNLMVRSNIFDSISIFCSSLSSVAEDQPYSNSCLLYKCEPRRRATTSSRARRYFPTFRLSFLKCLMYQKRPKFIFVIFPPQGQIFQIIPRRKAPATRKAADRSTDVLDPISANSRSIAGKPYFTNCMQRSLSATWRVSCGTVHETP
jgi:hypothetical protein